MRVRIVVAALVLLALTSCRPVSNRGHPTLPAKPSTARVYAT